jgi:hypothetical protein
MGTTINAIGRREGTIEERLAYTFRSSDNGSSQGVPANVIVDFLTRELGVQHLDATQSTEGMYSSVVSLTGNGGDYEILFTSRQTSYPMEEPLDCRVYSLEVRRITGPELPLEQIRAGLADLVNYSPTP